MQEVNFSHLCWCCLHPRSPTAGACMLTRSLAARFQFKRMYSSPQIRLWSRAFCRLGLQQTGCIKASDEMRQFNQFVTSEHLSSKKSASFYIHVNKSPVKRRLIFAWSSSSPWKSARGRKAPFALSVGSFVHFLTLKVVFVRKVNF